MLYFYCQKVFLHSCGVDKLNLIIKRIFNFNNASATTNFVDCDLFEMNLSPIWIVTNYKACVNFWASCWLMVRCMFKPFYQKKIFLMVATKLNQLAVTNQIRPSNSKTDDEFAVQILSDSKSDVEIRFWIKDIVNFQLISTSVPSF